MRTFLATMFPGRGATAIDHLLAMVAWIVFALAATALVEIASVFHMLIAGDPS